MKNLNSWLSVIMIFGTTTILFNGCSKHENKLVNDKNIVSLAEFKPNSGEVINLITTFNENYNTFKDGLKNSQTYSLNEAIWLIEAGVNYEFRSNKDSLLVLKTDTLQTTIKLFYDNAGQYFVTSNDLFEVYAEFLLFSEELTDENQKFILSDVVLESITGDEAEVYVLTTIGTIRPRQCFVQYDDYWYAVQGQGKCGGYSGDIGQDASNRINGLLNANNCMLWGCNGRVFFTDIYAENINMVFWEGTIEYCMNPEEIQQLVDEAFTFIDDQKPVGKVFYDLAYTWDLFGSTYVHVIQENTIRYAILNCDTNND